MISSSSTRNSPLFPAITALKEWGGVTFHWDDGHTPVGEGATVWSVFPATSRYFDPSPAQFMINYRVPDLERIRAELRSDGCDVDEKVEQSEFGKFGWVMDPEGNRLELWEPPPGRFPA